MSIFGNIMSAIFGHGAASQSSPSASGAQPSQGSQSKAPASTASPSVASGAAPQSQPVDVAAILNERAAHKGEKLNWRTSIVDLMKLLDLDSSLTARKQLAQELHYSGDMNDSAAMNMWLHKQVMKKLAENGGKVPADLAA